MAFLNKLVVVEDEDAVAHLVEAWMGDAGFLCLRARDGEEALKLIARETPDLIVLDVLMPKLDGIEVVRRLKADPVLSKVPVLMLTALNSVDDRVRGLDAGADDYLPKPFDMRELLARCQSLVRHNRRERDRSPTTDLPGPHALDDAIRARLQAGGKFQLFYVELNGFDALAADWPRAQAVLRQVANALGRLPRDEGIVTHMGGDDFVVIGGAELGTAQVMALIGDILPANLTASCEVVSVEGAKTPEDVSALVAKSRKKRA
jgi:DNA-binding response OmpR family regulator